MFLLPVNSVLERLSSEAHQCVSHQSLDANVRVLIEVLHLCKHLDTVGSEVSGLGIEPVGLCVIQRPHIGLRERRNGVENTLLPASSACAVPRYECLVVRSNHEVVLEVSSIGLCWLVGVESPQVLRWSIWQQIQQVDARHVVCVQLGCLCRHLESLPWALEHAFATTFAEVRDHDREQSARAWLGPFHGPEQVCGLRVGERHMVEEFHELILGNLGHGIDRRQLFTEDGVERNGLFRLDDHRQSCAHTVLERREFNEHLVTLLHIEDVAASRGSQDHIEVLCNVG